MMNLLAEAASNFFAGKAGIFIVIGLIGVSVLSSFFMAKKRGEGFLGAIISVIFPFVASALVAGGLFLITAAGRLLPEPMRIVGIFAIILGAGALIFYIRKRR